MKTFCNIHCILTLVCLALLAPKQTTAQNCFDADFESGTIGGYTAFHGEIQNNGVVLFPDQEIDDTQHKIMTIIDGYDPVAEQFCEENKRLLVTGSSAGKYTLRLGDVENGARTAKVVLSLDVTDDVSFFLLKYAIVLNDPGHNHSVQPRFELNIKDQQGNLLNCGHYEVRAAENIDGFESCEDWRVRPWTTAGFELASYHGQTINIEIISTDCGKGGHGGYAYIDATCTPLMLELESYCPGAAYAKYVVTEGFDEYLWNTGETSRFLEINDPIPGTEYQVTVTSSTGCTLVLRDTLPATPESSAIELSYFDNPDTLTVCFGDEVLYRPTGTNIETVESLELGYSSEEFYFYAEESQVYNFVTADNFGCAYDTTQLHLIVENLNLEFDITNTCSGQSNGEIYIDNMGDPNIQTALENGPYENGYHYNNLSPGEYDLHIKFGNDCEVTRTFTILSMATPELADIFTDPATCGEDNGTIAVIPEGISYEYSLNGSAYTSQATWQNLSGGLYELKFRADVDGCIETEFIEVKAYTKPVLNIVSIDSTTCNLDNGEIFANASGGLPPFRYSINGNAFDEISEFKNLAHGNFELIVRDSLNCRDTSQMTIYDAPFVQIDEVTTEASTCDEDNGKIEITVLDSNLPMDIYLDGQEVDGLSLQDVPNGAHEIVIIDHNDCHDEHYPFIADIPMPRIDSISYYEQICGNDVVKMQVHASSHNDSILYSPNGRLYRTENIFTIQPDTYMFSVRDDTGCTVDTLMDIFSNDKFWMPNIFSPDGDGDNDSFCCPDHNIQEIEEFAIYDRWGNKVFASANSEWGHYEACWDGRFNNVLVESGVYVYYIKVLRSDGRKICKYGDVTVVR